MKRSLEKEMMDLPCEAPGLLEEDLANLRIINACLGGHRAVLRAVRRTVRARHMKCFSLLDAGSGGGDIPVRIVEWSRNNGLAAQIAALDLEPVTVAMAARHTRAFPEIGLVRADAAAPPVKPGSVDFVLASQFLHHFQEPAIVALLRTWSRAARRAIILSDLVRHPVAYLGIRALTRLFTRNIMTLTDAPLSVQRAFTMAEWRALLREAAVGPFQLSMVFPFRMVAIISLDGRS